MVLLEIVVKRLAARTLEQRMKVHISAISLRKPRTIGLTQGPDARLAALVANIAAFVATPMIRPILERFLAVDVTSVVKNVRKWACSFQQDAGTAHCAVSPEGQASG
jgi:hypothetical protein